MTLHSSDLQKIAKLLGLVGSDHDAEALAAARKAHQLICEHGMTWNDVFGCKEQSKTGPAHHDLARELMTAKTLLTGFERNFLIGIMGHASLSVKQAETLESISAKVALAAETG